MRKLILTGAAAAALTLGVSEANRSAAVAQARAISASDRAQGSKAHPQLLQEFGGAYAGPQADYVRRVGQRIAVQSGLSNAQSDFTVTLLNSPVNNAFAVPGGYVYVTRQLLALMNDEAELASVMGHEVGHVAARHANSRARTSTIGGIGTLLLGVLTGSQQIAQIAGQAAQLYTLRFSRTQEYQADDLGITYLARAGYDPKASSTMLNSLAAQSALDTRSRNQSGRSVPTWASTHPDPASRVRRAAEKANATAARTANRNRDAFLAAIDGMLYDDDPRQGTIDGRDFRHRELRLGFTVPEGYAMTNSPRAVTVSGSGGQASFTGAAYAGDLERYVGEAFRTLAGQSAIEVGRVQIGTVNGLRTARASARANTESGPVDVTVQAYEFGRDTAYHFVTIVPAGQGIGSFGTMFASVRRLTNTEVAAIRSRAVDVVTVGPRDTLASLSGRMAYSTNRLERFLTLNALPAGAALRAGQKVKLIVYA